MWRGRSDCPRPGSRRCAQGSRSSSSSSTGMAWRCSRSATKGSATGCSWRTWSVARTGGDKPVSAPFRHGYDEFMDRVTDQGATLRKALALTCVILAVELTGGLLSHSLALLSDAGHVLTDVFALGLAWFAVEQAKRPADKRRSYGYHRVSILAALVNAVTLIVIVIAIAYEAVRRLMHPEPVAGAIVIVTALIGIAINTYVAFGLRGDRKSVNMRAALLHVTGDIGASMGVVLAGAVILLTG